MRPIAIKLGAASFKEVICKANKYPCAIYGSHTQGKKTNEKAAMR